MRVLCCILLAMVGPAAYGNVFAQAYPERPVRMIVGFPAGGAADILARILGQRLSAVWGQQVVVDNRPGAGSTLGSEIAAKSAPDGYTLLMISSSYAASAGLYRTGFDPIDAFAPVTLVASAPQVLLAHPSLPAKSISDLIKLAKASPAALNYGSAGNGSTTHLAGELFSQMTGARIVHVPYKGGAPALTDLIGGQIQLMFLALPAALPQIKSGKVQPLAVTSGKRSPSLPQVPTIAETVPGYEATNWYGVLAPKATPKHIVEKLNGDMVKAIRDPEVGRTIANQGAEPVGGSPSAFAAYLRSEIAKWTKVIKQAGVRSQ
jgi:tripartite-type tricarboxylate transporter receptor subunit TctC